MRSCSSGGISPRGLSRVPTPALRDPQGVLGQKAAEMRLFVWAQVGRGAVEGADVRLAVRAMATDMGWGAPMRRKATRSEENTSELQALMDVSCVLVCVKRNSLVTTQA